MRAAPTPVWRWPTAIMSEKDLTDAMRGGFDLHTTNTERGNRLFRLSRNGIQAPIGTLEQRHAYRAFMRGSFIQGDEVTPWVEPDGRRFTWRQLTLKPKARRK